MADRVKYFMLGLLFLVVAGVIAYDRAYESWNSDGEEKGSGEVARGEDRENEGEVHAGVKPQPLVVPPAPYVDPKPLAPPTPLVTPEEKPAPPVPPPHKPTPPPSATRTHVVKSGETLERIALRYYNTREGIAWIVDANSIRDPNHISIDTKLVIPARAESVVPQKPTVNPAPPPARADTKIPARYTVKAGDGDLYAICRRFYGSAGEGARVTEIMSLNGLFSATVAVGTEIRLTAK